MTGKARSRPRNPAIDLFRGALIFLVILGHLLEIEAPDGLAKWTIYGFHMPLFLGLSGYLCNLAGLRALGWSDVFRRYGGRLLLPWLIAMVVYNVPGWRELGWMTPVNLILHPPFHLWFVPALLCYLIFARLVPLDRRILVLVATMISGVALAYYGIGHHVALAGQWTPDPRLFLYAIFFFWGLFLATAPIRPIVAAAMAAAGLVAWLWLFGHPSPVGERMAFLVLNLGLVGLLPWLLARPWSFGPVEILGVDSLFFYLWHPFVIAWLRIPGLSGAALFGAALILLFIARAGISRLPFVARLVGLQPSNPLPPEGEGDSMA